MPATTTDTEPTEAAPTTDVDATTDEPATVFADAVDFSIKHPLQNSWTLWFDNPGKRTSVDNYAKTLKNLITFDTVEDFWGVYNNVTRVIEIPAGSNYHLFKAGVQPMWEDPANERGGKWVVAVPKSTREKSLDAFWLSTLLACIGEAFEESNEICGAVVSVRKAQDRVSLWTRSALDKEKTEAIGKKWKELLGVADNVHIGYQAHSEALQRGASYTNKDMYSV